MVAVGERRMKIIFRARLGQAWLGSARQGSSGLIFKSQND